MKCIFFVLHNKKRNFANYLQYYFEYNEKDDK